MIKSIWLNLTVLIFVFFISTPCHAQSAIEQSLSKGVIYGSEGKLDKAREELEIALKVDIYREPAKRALILIEDMKKGKIKAETTISFFKGAVHYLNGQLNEAIIQYSNAIASDPSYAIVYDNRGTLYLSIGDINKAVEDFSKAIELDPEFIDAYLNRGIAHTLGTGQYVRAISDYNKAIELDPADSLTYIQRGYLYMVKLHDREKACADWKTACDLGDCSYYDQAKERGQCN